jgi:uncharacterized Rossmann fold enzyme
MRFDTWEPLYLEILHDFGFSRDSDEEASRLLSDLLRSVRNSSKLLSKALKLVRGQSVVVCGNAHSLADELEDAIRDQESHIYIAADGATSTLLKAGLVPDIIVTDLDGSMEDILRANEMGSIMVVHAHGDNQDLLREYVPRLRNVIGTTQSHPTNGLYNFGGFTDGDRAVFLAKHLDALKIRLIGFDFEDESVTLRKHKKLLWAKRLIDLALSQEIHQSSGPDSDS